jgi:hypothetical protein
VPLRVTVEEFTRLFGRTVPKAKVKPASPAEPRTLTNIDAVLVPIDTRGMKLNAEQALSAQLYNRLVQLHLAGKLPLTFTAIQLELPIPAFTDQLRTIAVMIGRKRRAMGCIPGACDWVFVWKGGGAWIELKTPGGEKRMRVVQRVGYQKLHGTSVAPGRLSDGQLAFGSWCESTGANRAVCHTVDEAIERLRAWGAL